MKHNSMLLYLKMCLLKSVVYSFNENHINVNIGFPVDKFMELVWD